jgi:hypothetical protein
LKSRGVDEVQERRVIRQLARLAAAVPDVDTGLHDLRSPSARRRPRRSLFRALPAVAAAAAVAIGISHQHDHPPPRTSSPAPGASELVTFPAATALQLLLAPGPRSDA